MAFTAFVAALVLLGLPRHGDDWAGLVVELLVCASCAAVGFWPTPATLIAAAGVAATLLLVPTEATRPSLLAMLVPIAIAGTRGLHMVQGVVATWFVVVAAVNENSPPVPPERLAGRVAGWILLAAAGCVFGWLTRRLWLQREQSVRERAAAVEEQRRLIASDLHDTLAYSMTSIIQRAHMAQLRGVDDPLLADDLIFITRTGHHSLRDLRGMMQTLRRNDAAPETPRSPWRVTSLTEVVDRRVAHLRACGFTVEVAFDVRADDLPDSVRETLAKVTVEATSNIAKHADASGPCAIRLQESAEGVLAEFVNRPAKVRSRTGSGLGLVGARERVEALGGEVAVTKDEEAWKVHAWLPLEVV